MILAETHIKNIIKGMPCIQINSENIEHIKFSDGNGFELNRWLELKKDDAYPLVWLLPSKDSYKARGRELIKVCEFVIATRETRADLYNAERYNRSFKRVLMPVCEYLIEGLTKSTISDVISEDWDIFKYPNYSEADKHKTIDLWDAITLTINVRFSDDVKCLKPIIYGKSS